MQSSLHHSFETYGPLFTIGLALASWVLHRYKKAPHPMSFSETMANLGIFLVWRFLFFTGGIALQLWIFTKLALLIPWKLPQNASSLLLAVLAADFFYYWRHRYEHEFNLLWAEHSVHHSSEEYNLSTSLRLPWVASYFNWVFFLPALLFGFSAEQMLLGYQVVISYQYLIHSEFVGQLGALEFLLNTPSNHRVHHGRNEVYLDRNYGGILIVWDRLFGTFARETIPVDYGTVHPIRSKNPWTINTQPWLDLFSALRRMPTWYARFQLLFSKPGSLPN